MPIENLCNAEQYPSAGDPALNKIGKNLGFYGA